MNDQRHLARQQRRTELSLLRTKGTTNGITAQCGQNPYHDNPKSSNIYTPAPVADFIHDLLGDRDYKVVFDPAIGGGSLTNPWRTSGRMILGCDIDGNAAASADRPLGKDFTELGPEDVAQWPRAPT